MPTSSLDVSNSVVETSFRSGTEAAEQDEQASTSTAAQVLFVSESNVCRSVLAEAILKQQLKECGLDSMVSVQSKVQCTTMPCTTLGCMYHAEPSCALCCAHKLHPLTSAMCILLLPLLVGMKYA